MRFKDIIIIAGIAMSGLLNAGCQTADDVQEAKFRHNTERKLDELQAHLTVLSEQLDGSTAGQVTLEPEVTESIAIQSTNGGQAFISETVTIDDPNQPVVQITGITPVDPYTRSSRKEEIARLSQPLPVASTKKSTYRRKTKSSKRRRYSKKSSKMILISGLGARDVQQALKNAGFNPGPVDGKAGPKTKAAVMEFQRSEGLKVDGKIGSQTWNKLSPHLAAAAY